MTENDQFLFFCTNIGNEKLLKEEIRVFYPKFTLSYSRKGFITFKNKGEPYTVNTIAKLKVAFATRAGICLTKSKPEDVKATLAKIYKDLDVDVKSAVVHSFSINTEFELKHQVAFGRSTNEYSPINKIVINAIALGEKEVWFGVHKVGRSTSCYPNSNPAIEIPADSPSKAYLKIAEAIACFNIDIQASDNWLDFGSAPGGSSHYLLNKGCKVWGIDPAKMSDKITDNAKYTHITSPVQDLSQEKLPDLDIEWIHADLNLNPNQAIKEVLRLAKKYNFTLKGMIFTIQLVKMDYIKELDNFEAIFLDWGFKFVISSQMPSHKNEFVIYAKK